MTPPNFSILLLAWDDADPSVAVLGTAALPPTQALVYELATQYSVLAIYPHLPAEAPVLPTNRSQKPASPAPSTATGVAEPGVRLLPALAPVRPVPASRMVGLYDLAAGRKTQPPARLEPNATAVITTSTRSQWPSGPDPAQPRSGQAPAAPYLGASPTPVAPVPAATPVSAQPRLARPLVPQRVPQWTSLRPNPHPLAGDLNFDPNPELPSPLQRTAFDEPTKEIGPAEAADLSADLSGSEHNPVPDPTTSEPTSPPPAELLLPVAPVALLLDLDGLNFRMIQYARRAAQLVRDRRDFGVIYAPNWPAWLAALEIRNNSGRPLVLYAAALAADTATPTKRGWLLEVERMALRRATLILVPDERLRRRLRARYGATIGEVRVVAATDEPGLQRVLADVARA